MTKTLLAIIIIIVVVITGLLCYVKNDVNYLWMLVAIVLAGRILNE